MKKLVIIDGYNLFFRAFYATAYSTHMYNLEGLPTNALYVMSNILFNIIENNDFEYAVVALDSKDKTFRHDLYNLYKSNRKEIPVELKQQLCELENLIKSFGLYYIKYQKYEADDIIGTICSKYKNELNINIYSNDKDLFQLIDKNINVLFLNKGSKDITIFNVDSFKTKYNIEPQQFVDYKALVGDKSDNIPGVNGIGDKTAQKLLNKYVSLKQIYKNIDDLSKTYRNKLKNSEKEAFLSKKLSEIHKNIPLKLNLDLFKYNGIDFCKSEEFFKKINSLTLLKKIQKINISETNKRNIKCNNDFEQLYNSLSSLTDEFCVDTDIDTINFGKETIMYVDFESKELYVSLVTSNKYYYFTWKKFINSEKINQWLINKNLKKILIDSKKIYKYLFKEKKEIEGVIFDFVLAIYILSPEKKIDNFFDLINYIGISNKNVKNIKHKTELLNDIYYHLLSNLKKENLFDILINIEIPIARILSEMESTGIKVDKNILINKGENIKVRLRELEEKIYNLADKKFNISSPKQLSEVLFDELKLPIVKKNKNNKSTSIDVLEKLKNLHPIILEIIEYRKLSKLYNTYIKGMILLIDYDCRIHTEFKQTSTLTGRLSSVEPNLQNIPSKNEYARSIRKAFINDNGCELVSFDYSQIELRILAYFSKSEYLLRIFNEDRDIHTETALKLFNLKDINDITPEMRSQAKTVNFGIIYGISDFGLSNQLNVSREYAKKFIDNYFKQFEDIKNYIDNTIKKVEKTHYVETLMGRRRYFHEINSKNMIVRNFAKRAAINMPIQGTAGDIIKMAMINIYNNILCNDKSIKLVLQIHDELIFNIPKDKLHIIKKIKEYMETVVDINVPLKVNYNIGKTWYDL